MEWKGDHFKQENLSKKSCLFFANITNFWNFQNNIYAINNGLDQFAKKTVIDTKYLPIFQIDGEADFIIPIDALQRFDPHLDIDTLLVEANVTESPTGISDMGSKQVQFHKDIWKIEFFDGSPDYFKPGFKYTTYVSAFLANLCQVLLLFYSVSVADYF